MLRYYQLPLKRRLFIGIGLMLLPLLLLVVSSYFSSQKIVSTFEDATEETIHEQLPIMRIQNLLHKAWMPANDYLVHGHHDERENFAYLSGEVNVAFDHAFKETYELSEERHYLEKSYQEWKRGEGIAKNLLQIENPIGNKVAASKMEEFDGHIDGAVKHLEVIYKFTKTEIDEKLTKAHDIRKFVILTLTTISILGITISFTSALALTRSIINPIKILDDGVNRFGNGELNHRVNLCINDEIGVLANSFNNMAERIEEIQQELKDLSTHDYLTGTYNRLEFYRRLEQELTNSKGSGSKLALLLIDIDYFKNVNDNYGHQAGDEILCFISKIISEIIGENNLLARYGGEEFAVLLTDTDYSSAAEVAERIRSTIENQTFKTSLNQVLKSTISIGLTIYPVDADNSRELIILADKALYSAKNTGRNRICTARDENPKLHEEISSF